MLYLLLVFLLSLKYSQQGFFFFCLNYINLNIIKVLQRASTVLDKMFRLFIVVAVISFNISCSSEFTYIISIV